MWVRYYNCWLWPHQTGVEFLTARLRKSGGHNAQNDVRLSDMPCGFRVEKGSRSLSGVRRRDVDRQAVHGAEGLQSKRGYLVGGVAV